MLPADLAAHYQVLDLPAGASMPEIKRAYQLLVRVWHPDRYQHDAALLEKSTSKLAQINTSYNALRAASDDDRSASRDYAARDSRTASSSDGSREAESHRRAARERESREAEERAERARDAAREKSAAERAVLAVLQLEFDAAVCEARAIGFPFEVGARPTLEQAIHTPVQAKSHIADLLARLHRWKEIRSEATELTNRAREIGFPAPTQAILSPEGLTQYSRAVVEGESVHASLRDLDLAMRGLRIRAAESAYPGGLPLPPEFSPHVAVDIRGLRTIIDEAASRLARWEAVGKEAMALQDRLVAVGESVDLGKVASDGGIEWLRRVTHEAERTAERATESRRRRKIFLRGCLGSIALAATSLSIFWVPGQLDSAACGKARLANSVLEWQAYATDRPGGRCASEAATRIEAIPCEIASASDTALSWTEYLASTPNGQCAALAERRLSAIPCELARRDDTHVAWFEYLSANPEGECVDEAARRLTELPCEAARAADSVDGWRTYLAENAEGPCAVEARSRIADLPCELAGKHDTIEAWTAILTTASAAPCAAAATRRVDELRCERARGIGTEAGWLAYLGEKPIGSCVGEAKTALHKLKCGEPLKKGAILQDAAQKYHGTYSCELQCGDTCNQTRLPLYEYWSFDDGRWQILPTAASRPWVEAAFGDRLLNDPLVDEGDQYWYRRASPISRGGDNAACERVASLATCR